MTYEIVVPPSASVQFRLPLLGAKDTTVSFPGSSLGTTRDHWGNDGFDDTLLRDDVHEKFRGYTPDVFQREAESWILQQKKAAKPFFCFYPTIIMHGPEFVTEEMKVPFKQYGETRARIYAYLKHYDDLLGAFRKFLDKNELSDNTILVFLSDNGGLGIMTDLWNALQSGCVMIAAKISPGFTTLMWRN